MNAFMSTGKGGGVEVGGRPRNQKFLDDQKKLEERMEQVRIEPEQGPQRRLVPRGWTFPRRTEWKSKQLTVNERGKGCSSKGQIRPLGQGAARIAIGRCCLLRSRAGKGES